MTGPAATTRILPSRRWRPSPSLSAGTVGGCGMVPRRSNVGTGIINIAAFAARSREAVALFYCGARGTAAFALDWGRGIREGCWWV